MIDVSNLTIKKAREMLDSKKVTVTEIVESYLSNIKSKNPELNAYLEVYTDLAEQIKEAQNIIDSNKSSVLTGIPIAVKDNILIRGKKVSASSKMLENYVASFDATVIKKLKEQGAIFIGRTNMDEFALGGSTEKSAFGVTKNPHDPTRVAGGTSGGSASAVASDMTLLALGSDTGGSVRQPASFCGVVGLKPGYGRVSRFGLISAVSSFDQIGPMAKTVSDVETLFNAIYGKDPLDGTSVENIDNKKIAKKIGVPRAFVEMEGISPEVKANFAESIEKLKSLGYEIKDIEIPNMKYCLPVYYIINFAEVSSNLARFDGLRYGMKTETNDLLEAYKKNRGQFFGPEVRRRIILGTYVLSSGYYDAYYGKALRARNILKNEFDKAFAEVDAILTPTSPTPAWKIGEKSNPLEDYLADIFTVTANIVGCPAMSVPSGFAKIQDKDLPLGIQLMAPEFSENTLFEIGKKFLGESL